MEIGDTAGWKPALLPSGFGKWVLPLAVMGARLHFATAFNVQNSPMEIIMAVALVAVLGVIMNDIRAR